MDTRGPGKNRVSDRYRNSYRDRETLEMADNTDRYRDINTGKGSLNHPGCTYKGTRKNRVSKRYKNSYKDRDTCEGEGEIYRNS